MITSDETRYLGFILACGILATPDAFRGMPGMIIIMIAFLLWAVVVIVSRGWEG